MAVVVVCGSEVALELLLDFGIHHLRHLMDAQAAVSLV